MAAPGHVLNSDRKITIVTQAFTAKPDDDVILVDASAGAFAVSLPSAKQNPGTELVFRSITTGANVVTVAPALGEALDGGSSLVLGASGLLGARLLAADGQWRQISGGLPGSVETSSPAATIVRNSDGSVNSATYGSAPLTHTVAAIVRDSFGRVTGFTLDGTVHGITRNGAGLVTAVS